jgi:hypothetical protein
VLISCQIVPDADRESSRDTDTECTTGEVAHHLTAAGPGSPPRFNLSTPLAR